MRTLALFVFAIVTTLTWALMGAPNEIVWSAEREAGRLLAGEILGEVPDVLRLENTTSHPRRIIMLELDAPTIETPQWHLMGQVRHRDIEGHGYLELLAVLPSGSFATRTFGRSGPQGRLTGTTDWRALWIPFDGSASEEVPSKLVLAVHLPAHSTVDLRGFSVREGLGSPATVTPGTWWGERTASWMFGGGAALILTLAVALGLAGRQQNRSRMVLGGYRAVIAIALIVALSGIVAAAIGQPTTVYFPLILVGLLACGIFGFGYRSAFTLSQAQRQAQAE